MKVSKETLMCFGGTITSLIGFTGLGILRDSIENQDWQDAVTAAQIEFGVGAIMTGSMLLGELIVDMYRSKEEEPGQD